MAGQSQIAETHDFILMDSIELVPHPSSAPKAVRSIRASLDTSDRHWLKLRWRIEGAGRIVLSPFTGNVRRDELWRTTCLELFVRRAGDNAYSEFNFSPSQAWAAYDFDEAREGMRERAMERPPVIQWRGGQSALAIFDVAVSWSCLPPLPLDYHMSAVIEEGGGATTYWAFAHSNPGRPDFHDPACFTGRLEAPGAP